MEKILPALQIPFYNLTEKLLSFALPNVHASFSVKCYVNTEATAETKSNFCMVSNADYKFIASF